MRCDAVGKHNTRLGCVYLAKSFETLTRRHSISSSDLGVDGADTDVDAVVNVGRFGE
jgi:hypothetical protein